MGNNKYKRKHKEAGLCLFCSEKVLPGYLYCRKHLLSKHESDARWYRANIDKKKKYFKKLKKGRIENNLCVECGVPLDPDIDSGVKRCLNCRHQVYRQRRPVEYFQKKAAARL